MAEQSSRNATVGMLAEHEAPQNQPPKQSSDKDAIARLVHDLLSNAKRERTKYDKNWPDYVRYYRDSLNTVDERF